MSIPVVPAIIPESLAHLRAAIAAVAWSPEVQLDLVDGRFVDTVSWPYEPAGEPLDIKTELDCFTLEIDLMVNDPVTAATAWLKAGADMLIFHVESLSVHDFIQFADNCPVTVGVAAHGDTTVDTIAHYATHADYIQLMGIKEIGAQGQPFDDSVLERVTALRTRFPDRVIAVDGSVNLDTIVRLKTAGVNRMIVGSAIMQQPDPKAAHAALTALIN
jgi:ribulose-phosphate 3-epimerase